MRLAGAVLAGGQSRRMGRTKAVIDVDGRPMAQRVAEALDDAGCGSVVVVGGDIEELAVLGLPIVDDLFVADGPVGGVITALRHHATATHVVVAACDLPALTADTVRLLIAASDSGADVVAAQTDRVEPALAVWRVDTADRLQTAFDGGLRALHEALALLDATTVAVDPAAMRNVNRPSDVPNRSRRDAEGGQ